MKHIYSPSLIALSVMTAINPMLALAQSSEVPEEENNQTLEVIEVTAQKRVQSINDTAIAITAISGDAITNQGSTSYDEAIEGVPGVKVQGIAQGAQVFIRGVGSQIDPAFADPAIATLIDGVYTGRTESVQSGTYDISRIEVLRGPQGTLYGRNASGGSMNVITRDPQLGGTEGYITAQVGNYQLRRLEGAVNISLTDDIAIRIAGFNSDRDGYISDGSMEDNTWGARAKVLFQPSEDMRALLKYETSEFEGNAANTVPVEGWQGNLTFPPFLGAFAPEGWAVNDSSDPWENDQYHLPGYMLRKSDTWSLDLSTDLDWASISLLTAYSEHENLERTSHLFGIADPDVFFGCGTPDCYTEGTGNATYKTAELRFNSPVDSPLIWMVGLYYLSSQGDIGGDGQELDLSGGTYLYNQAFAPSKTKAVFGQATYPVTEQFRITAGLRFSNDTRESAYELFSPDGALVDMQSQSTEDDSTTWKLGVEYDVSKDQLIYAHAASGFKQGGVNTTIPVTVFAPEELISYEIGTKNTLLNNNMQLNAALFYYDYKNYQVPSLQTIPVAETGEVSIFPYALNAGDSTIYGAEVTLEWLVSENGRLSASATTLQTEYGETELPVNPFVSGGPYQLAGRDMVNAPAFTAMLGYEHNWELENGTIVASVTSNYSSDYYTTVEYYLPGAQQESYTRSDLNVRYESFDDWTVGFWVRNLENDAQTTYVFPAYRRFVTAPRTIGVNLNYRF